jgi:hypothetical protein
MRNRAADRAMRECIGNSTRTEDSRETSYGQPARE